MAEVLVFYHTQAVRQSEEATGVDLCNVGKAEAGHLLGGMSVPSAPVRRGCGTLGVGGSWNLSLELGERAVGQSSPGLHRFFNDGMPSPVLERLEFVDYWIIALDFLLCCYQESSPESKTGAAMVRREGVQKGKQWGWARSDGTLLGRYVDLQWQGSVNGSSASGFLEILLKLFSLVFQLEFIKKKKSSS